MSAEFIDTNILIYAHDGGSGAKHVRSVELIARLFTEECGALSIQVLSEFYTAATRKLGMESTEAEESIRDLASWTIHRPAHSDVVKAIHLHRRYKLAWWDALILNSASELGCTTLWSEDFSEGRTYGGVTVKNPFH
jgi:predicted nucleic acid-binding protein